MHRVVGSLPSSQVASRRSASTGSDLQIVIIVYMASRAGDVGVALSERKAGARVIEIRTVPACGGVTVRAITNGEGRAGSRVGRIVGGLPSTEMATGISAIGRRDR